jgi:cation:H+ antiporter
MIIIDVVLLIFFGFWLIKATNMTLVTMQRLVRVWGINPFGLASLILAFSTSLPELVVALVAGMKGEGDLVLGNILGSNIANMSLVLGGAALISGSLRATDAFLKREVMYVFLAGSFPLLLLMDQNLSRMDGVVLLAVYGLYNLTVLKRKRIQLTEAVIETDPWWQRILIKVTQPKTEKGILHLIMAVALLVISAEMVVRTAVNLASILGFSKLIIGLFVVAVGTSLPELVFEIEAIRKREVGMAFGNILGSVVANSTGILGLTALLSPVTLANGFMPYLVATMAYVLIFFSFWGLVRTKHRLDRWEGGALVLLYMVFVLIEVLKLT